MNFLEKSRNKLVHLLFPFIERFYIVIFLILFVAFWAIPSTYWQIRGTLIWLFLVISNINYDGNMERDRLPLQPVNTLFYHIYRFSNLLCFLLLLLWLIMLFFPVPVWLKFTFLGVFVIAGILQAIGDHKYRPKKPEE